MPTPDLKQIIAILNALDYGPIPDNLGTPYTLATWLVQQGILSSSASFDDKLSVPELWDLLLTYGIIDLTRDPTIRLVRIPTPAVNRSRLAYAASVAPFADLARTESMLVGLRELANTVSLRVRFSNLSGLVRTLRGDLLPGEIATDPGNMIERSQVFLDQFSLALVGDKQLNRTLDQQAVLGNVTRWQQTTARELPVYGGRIQAGFDNLGRLTMIASSWFPIPIALDDAINFQLDWRTAAEIAVKFIAEQQPKLDLFTEPSENGREGRVLYPYLRAAPVKRREQPPPSGNYRPAWAVLVGDKAQVYSWELIVDDETGVVLNPVLNRRHVGATIALCVLPDNQKALAYNKGDPNVAQTAFIEIGAAPDLQSVTDFPLRGSAFQPPVPCATPSLTAKTLRAGNVYYHLRQAQQELTTVVKAAWPGVVGVPIVIPGTQQPLPVQLESSDGIVGVYNRTGQPTLTFDQGQLSSDIANPMDDCEVIYHEYAHALFDAVQPDLYTIEAPEPFPDALNEGLAFYFGASLSQRLQQKEAEEPPVRWGEVAYSSKLWTDPGWRDLQRIDPELQRADHDFLQIYQLFPQYATTDVDPAKAGGEYSCGMAWARILWDLRRVVGPTIADAVILRALNITNGMQSELETPAEAIIHYDSEHAPGGPAHEGVLRLIFSGRGVMADAPIHDLRKVVHQNQSYLLAATERNSLLPGSSGCQLSADNGANWQPLGSGGPSDHQALAVVATSSTQTLIFAAGEVWPTTLATPPQSNIYWYELAGNAPDLQQPWQALPPINPLRNWDIYHLFATNVPTGGWWLFAGTEDGLYLYQSPAAAQLGAWLALPLMPGNRVLAVAGQMAPQSTLLIATNLGLGVFSFDGQTWQPAAGSSSLIFFTIVPDPIDPALFWLGGLNGNIYQFTTQSGMKFYGTVGWPIFSLWVERDANDQILIYAGTNKGVIRHGGAQAITPLASVVTGETPANTTVVASLGDGDQVWFGTAQRGLWRYNPQTAAWVRQVTGFPRVGQLVDALAPPGPAAWVQNFVSNGTLALGAVATYLFYLPDASRPTLRVVSNEAVTLKLFYMVPQVDLDTDQYAGLQKRTLAEADNQMRESVQPGFYIVAVTPWEQPTTYQISITLQ